MFLRWLKVFLFLATVSVCSGLPKLEVRMESVNNIAGEEETLVVFKLRLVGRERFLNGTVTLLADLGEKYEGAVDIYSFRNGEWTQSYITIRTTPCDLYTNYIKRYFFPSDADTNLVPDGEYCCKQGVYYLKYIPISVENWPTWPYRGIVKIYRLKGKKIGGFEAVCNIIDKPV